MMQLRDYQVEAKQAFMHALENVPGAHPVIAQPTGTGKSHVQAGIFDEIMTRWPGARIIGATHRKEIIAQNAEKLITLLPYADIGVHSAGLKQRDYDNSIVVGGIQSMVKNAHKFGRIDLVMVDEGHMVGPSISSSYIKFLHTLWSINNKIRIGCMTATPYRHGMGLLVEGKLFNHMAINQTTRDKFNWFIEQGYLSTLVPYHTTAEFDVSQVKVVAGEFNQRQLQDVVNKDNITYNALGELCERAADCHTWLVFGTGIQHVEHITNILQSMNIDAACAHSKMTNDANDEVLNAYTSGNLRCLVNDSKFTTGFDYPMIDCIAMLNPTRITTKYVQLCGRGTRPVYAPGYDLSQQQGRLAAIAAGPKPNGTLVLDFAGNVARIGPMNDPRLPKKPGVKTGIIPVKICSEGKLRENTGAWPMGCGAYNHTVNQICDGCGGEFKRMTMLQDEASNLDLIVGKHIPEYHWFDVDTITYQMYKKQNMPRALRVIYHCGKRKFPESICLEHAGYASKVARDWWRYRNNNNVPVNTVNSLTLTDDILEPISIKIDIAARHRNIVQYRWKDQ